MKKYMKWVLLTGVAGFAVMALAQSAPSQKTAPATGDLQVLQGEVAQLRARVQALEGRTQKLESDVTAMSHPHLMPLVTPPANPPLIQLPQADSTPPTIWGQKKVNGWTVYIVPCEQQDH